MALTDKIQTAASAVLSSWAHACSSPEASDWDDDVGSAISSQLYNMLEKERRRVSSALQDIEYVPTLPDPPMGNGDPAEILKQIQQLEI